MAMKLSSMEDLFTFELQDLYSAEKQLMNMLPDIVDAVSSPRLRAALEEDIESSRGRLERLERIFEMLDRRPGRFKCEGMEGILDESKDIVDARADEAVKDAAIIGVVQRAKHYELAGYGTARTYARNLGLQQAGDLLQQSLNEEGQIDHRLTDIAVDEVNPRACGKSAEEEESWPEEE